ncbi:MAG TPA: metal-sulfur cluster assembly factor [Actinomycetota bacterium]|jgi:metal-sulfur cluster biosynthetic enzyme
MAEFMEGNQENLTLPDPASEPVEALVEGADVDRSTDNGGSPNGEKPGSLKDQVLEVLKNVHDPELGVNIVDLGLVYGVEIEDQTVHVTYTLTTMGCPIGPLIEAEMKQFLSNVEGIEEVNAEMVLRPPWTPEMMSEEAKAALGYF